TSCDGGLQHDDSSPPHPGTPVHPVHPSAPPLRLCGASSVAYRPAGRARLIESISLEEVPKTEVAFSAWVIRTKSAWSSLTGWPARSTAQERLNASPPAEPGVIPSTSGSSGT